MNVSPIVFVLPAYGLFMGVEAGWAKLRKVRTYDPAELIANTSAGLGQLVTDVWLGALYLVPYTWLSNHAAPYHFRDDDWVAWVVAIIGVDFAFYWQHRISHRVNFIWAAHVVHHQPETYNLSVALRQPWFSALTNWIYYQPLAVIGVPNEVFVVSIAVNLAYQFYLHTPFVGRIGPLGWVLNTPSHHRVHHGRNARYLDKNFGGILIVWDRWFGTFEPEGEPVDYGTVVPFRSRDGVWANFEHWAHLLARSRQSRSLADRIALWFRPPEWRGVDEAPALPGPPLLAVERGILVYAAFTTLTAIAGAMAILAWRPPAAVEALSALVILWTLWCVGALLDGRRWSRSVELVRVFATTTLAAVFYGALR